MKHLITAIIASAFAASALAADISMAVPGAETANGRKVLTFIAKDPPGQRCNGNLQVAAEIANAFKVPIQLLPASMVPDLPAPAVFYGKQLIVADGKDFNGISSFQIVADVLDIEDVPRQPKSGLLFNEKVRPDFDALKATIKAGVK